MDRGAPPKRMFRLEYDPFVSVENSETVQGRGEFQLLDLRSARNGTRLDWSQLPIGGSAHLRCGDIVDVGRSLLVFRDS